MRDDVLHTLETIGEVLMPRMYAYLQFEGCPWQGGKYREVRRHVLLLPSISDDRGLLSGK